MVKRFGLGQSAWLWEVPAANTLGHGQPASEPYFTDESAKARLSDDCAAQALQLEVGVAVAIHCPPCSLG